MVKRILAAFLWFLAVAYAWNLVALLTGVSTAPAFVLGAAAALLVAGDPLHRIWSTRRETTPQATEPSLA